MIETPFLAFLAGIGGWFAALALIYFQKPREMRANCELLTSLFLYHFAFGSQKIFIEFPEIVPAAVVLTLWLVGIGFFEWRRGRAFMKQIRFMLPFAIPFLIVTSLSDMFDDWLTLAFAGVGALFLIMIFLPLFFQTIWKCTPLENERLEALCRKANFRHAGIKTWTIMNDSPTAAIIGVLPRWRYVMFTKRLLETFQPEWLDAVLAHEIGHSKRGHLLLFPFITCGMVLFASLVLSFALRPLDGFVSEEFYPLVVFVIFAGSLAFAFRFLFGYFSRLFERQADLYIFELGIDANHMADALDKIGNMTGYSHKTPNWHHYSIQDRIDFIRAASYNPALIAKHNRKVSRSLRVYFITLMILGVFLW